MNKRWIYSAALLAASVFVFPAGVARADRDDYRHRDRYEYRDHDRDRHRDYGRSHRYYHRDWDSYYRGPIYDRDRWRVHYRFSPGYRYYDDYDDYRDYYATPWWDGGGFHIEYYNH